ncbi:MAG: Gfo/Idh/MocA family oxidoreductase [Clostridia bacterium]|nr:Gfo/Idh/MocA family oxidoreductase [Clostridia bacterium]
MEKTVKIGIVGVGNIGSVHLSTLAKNKVKGGVLSGACDIDAQKLKALKDAYPQLSLFEDYEDLLNSGIDAVIIATPHYLHPIIAERAIEKGIHVLIEKPFGVFTKGGEALCQRARDKGVVFGIMLNQRTNKLFSLAHELVKNGEIGKIRRHVWIITNWYRTQEYYESDSWRGSWQGEGGGVLLNQAPHNLDLWQWICGMPKSIYAICKNGKYHDISVEDEATIFAEYENGATGTFITTTGDKYGTNRLEISGERGSIVLEKGRLILQRDGQTPRTFRDKEYNGHLEIVQDFTNAILYKKELLAPASEGLKSLEISNCAYLSSYKNEKVDLPINEDEFLGFLDIMQKNEDPVSKNETDKPLSSTYQAKWNTNW